MKQQKHIQTSVLRKPTRDCTVPNDSCHPIQNRLPTIRYFSNRINAYPLNELEKENEITPVANILYNIKYDVRISNDVNKEKK